MKQPIADFAIVIDKVKKRWYDKSISCFMRG
jgi:hypothetical protein